MAPPDLAVESSSGLEAGRTANETVTADTGKSVSVRTTAKTIACAPASLADDEAIVTRVTELINTVYAAEEAEFWKDGFIRTSTDEIRQCIRAGELALAYRPGVGAEAAAACSSPDSPVADPADIMGCVRFQLLDARTGEFGMLVCDAAARGSGIGRDLLQFAEKSVKERGAEIMRLELLVGDGWLHPLKERLGQWYERAGYKLVTTGSIRDSFPRLAPMIAEPSLFRVYEKVL